MNKIDSTWGSSDVIILDEKEITAKQPNIMTAIVRAATVSSGTTTSPQVGSAIASFSIEQTNSVGQLSPKRTPTNNNTSDIAKKQGDLFFHRILKPLRHFGIPAFCFRIPEYLEFSIPKNRTFYFFRCDLSLILYATGRVHNLMNSNSYQK